MIRSPSLIAIASLPWLACGGSGADREVTASVDFESTVAEVSERFLSVAVDSSQVVGSFFWDPDATPGETVGSNPIDPYDFDRPRLRRMAKELAPAYLRIGGTDADSIYYDLSDDPVEEPPAPYEYVMTRAQFDGLNQFALDLGYRVFFTLNAGPGPRGEDEAWTPDNARALVEYAAAQGYPVELWELGNEPNAFTLIHDLSLSPEQLAADVGAARALLDEADPEAKLAAPSVAFWPEAGEILPVLEDFLAAGGGEPLDVMTWHYYPQQSVRCPVATRRAEPGTLLDPAHLDELDTWAGYVEDLRDQHAPGVEVWLGESGNAQCGGEPGISDAYEGGFWWLDQLGRAAARGQRVVVRQTLSGSNYGLIDEATLEPNPDYFTSLLWRRLMGTRVLDAGSPDPMVRVYAHCARGRPGEVALALLNLDPDASVRVDLGAAYEGEVELYLLTAAAMDGRTLELNGRPLAVEEDGSPPELSPELTGEIVLPARSYGFAVLPGASAPACPD